MSSSHSQSESSDNETVPMWRLIEPLYPITYNPPPMNKDSRRFIEEENVAFRRMLISLNDKNDRITRDLQAAEDHIIYCEDAIDEMKKEPAFMDRTQLLERIDKLEAKDRRKTFQIARLRSELAEIRAQSAAATALLISKGINMKTIAQRYKWQLSLLRNADESDQASTVSESGDSESGCVNNEDEESKKDETKHLNDEDEVYGCNASVFGTNGSLIF